MDHISHGVGLVYKILRRKQCATHRVNERVIPVIDIVREVEDAIARIRREIDDVHGELVGEIDTRIVRPAIHCLVYPVEIPSQHVARERIGVLDPNTPVTECPKALGK